MLRLCDTSPCEAQAGPGAHERNLRTNQASGCRKMNKRPQTLAVPKRAPRPGVQRGSGKLAAKPHLKSRSIYAALNVLSELMFAPTASYVHVGLSAFLYRVRCGWEEEAWAAYFEKTYCARRPVDKDKYATENIFCPDWWSGASAQEPGFPSTQQPAEQMNCSSSMLTTLFAMGIRDECLGVGFSLLFRCETLRISTPARVVPRASCL